MALPSSGALAISAIRNDQFNYSGYASTYSLRQLSANYSKTSPDAISEFYNTGLVTSGRVFHVDAGIAASYSGSGVNWYDLSGTGTNATLVNTPTYSTSGGGSIIFNGINNYANMGNATSLQFERTSPFSISTWIKHTYTGAGSNIISKQLNTSPYTGWGLGTANRASVSYLELFIYNGSVASNSVIVDYPSGYSDGVWMNICVTYSGNSSSSGVVLYRNGASVAGTVITSSIGITINTAASAQLSGRGGAASFWPGSMGNAIIYNRVLSAAEVLQNFTAQRFRFGI
jgi:hypothetical protein